MFKRILGGLIISAFVVANVYAKTEKIRIEGDHGQLAAIRQMPDNVSQYPLVILLHGFSASKDMPMFRQIADKLEKENIASIRFDFNGHGESEGRFSDMTILNELEDAKKVYEYVRTMPEVTYVSVAGHSQGGVVASLLAAELGAENIRSIVLLAPAAVLHDGALSGEILGGKFNPNELPETVTLPANHTIGRKYIEVAQKLDMYEPAERYQGDVLIVHGTDDWVVSYEYGQKYHETYSNSEIVPLQGADHLFLGYTDEVVKIISEYLAEQLHK